MFASEEVRNPVVRNIADEIRQAVDNAKKDDRGVEPALEAYSYVMLVGAFQVVWNAEVCVTVLCERSRIPMIKATTQQGLFRSRSPPTTLLKHAHLEATKAAEAARESFLAAMTGIGVVTRQSMSKAHTDSAELLLVKLLESMLVFERVLCHKKAVGGGSMGDARGEAKAVHKPGLSLSSFPYTYKLLNMHETMLDNVQRLLVHYVGHREHSSLPLVQSLLMRILDVHWSARAERKQQEPLEKFLSSFVRKLLHGLPRMGEHRTEALKMLVPLTVIPAVSHLMQRSILDRRSPIRGALLGTIDGASLIRNVIEAQSAEEKERLLNFALEWLNYTQVIAHHERSGSPLASVEHEPELFAWLQLLEKVVSVVKDLNYCTQGMLVDVARMPLMILRTCGTYAASTVILSNILSVTRCIAKYNEDIMEANKKLAENGEEVDNDRCIRTTEFAEQYEEELRNIEHAVAQQINLQVSQLNLDELKVRFEQLRVYALMFWDLEVVLLEKGKGSSRSAYFIRVLDIVKQEIEKRKKSHNVKTPVRVAQPRRGSNDHAASHDRTAREQKEKRGQARSPNTERRSSKEGGKGRKGEAKQEAVTRSGPQDAARRQKGGNRGKDEEGKDGVGDIQAETEHGGGLVTKEGGGPASGDECAIGPPSKKSRLSKMKSWGRKGSNPEVKSPTGEGSQEAQVGQSDDQVRGETKVAPGRSASTKGISIYDPPAKDTSSGSGESALSPSLREKHGLKGATPEGSAEGDRKETRDDFALPKSEPRKHRKGSAATTQAPWSASRSTEEDDDGVLNLRPEEQQKLEQYRHRKKSLPPPVQSHGERSTKDVTEGELDRGVGGGGGDQRDGNGPSSSDSGKGARRSNRLAKKAAELKEKDDKDAEEEYEALGVGDHEAMHVVQRGKETAEKLAESSRAMKKAIEQRRETLEERKRKLQEEPERSVLGST